MKLAVRFEEQEQRLDCYGDAIDVLPCRYTYTETDQPTESEENDEESFE